MSNLLEQASLVLIPSGYKAGTVYSQIPLDGAGDLQFTRALDTATRVGSDGLIEKVRTNIILQSQTFDNAGWTKNAGSSVTANTTIAPDGTTTADTLDVAATLFSGLYQTFTTTTNTWTISLFVKKGTKDFIYLFDPTTNKYGWFNLNTGAVGQKTASTETSIISVGNGWYRISVTTSVTANVSHFVQFGLSDSDGDFTPTSTGTAFIWGAQAEVSDFGATPYIPTTTAAVSVGMLANVPRLDYLNSTCPKLLLEPQRTNLQIYSENSGLWQQPADGLTVVYNTTETLDPAGFNGAEKVTFSSGNGRMFEAVANAIGSVTMSAFIKAGTGNTIRLRTTSASIFVDFNLTTQTITPTIGTGTITNYGNGWYRLTATGTSAVTPEVAQYIFPNSAGQFVYFWGAQFENGSYATSYIPTLGAAVTRSVDAALKTGISALIGQTEGTLFLEVNVNKQVNLGGAGPNGIEISNGSTSGIYLGIAYTSPITFLVARDNAGSFSPLISTTNSALGTYKMAVAYSSAGFVFFLNGVQIGTSATLPPAVTYSALALSSFGLVPSSQGELYNQALLFPTRLTNALLAQLTTI